MAEQLRRPRVSLLLVVLAGLVASCNARNNKVSSTLDEAESYLEKSEKSLQSVKDKPLEEAVKELEELYEGHMKMLERMTELQNESFTKEEKARFDRILEKSRERKTALSEAREEIKRKIKEAKKQ